MVLLAKKVAAPKVTVTTVTDTFTKQLNGVIAARQVNVLNSEKRIESLEAQIIKARDLVDESLAEIQEAQGKLFAVAGEPVTEEIPTLTEEV